MHTRFPRRRADALRKSGFAAALVGLGLSSIALAVIPPQQTEGARNGPQPASASGTARAWVCVEPKGHAMVGGIGPGDAAAARAEAEGLALACRLSPRRAALLASA